jgi:hypothetical protein
VHSTSGYVGVDWYRLTGKWRARIKINGRKTHLGYFECPKAAARAYDAMARYLCGGHAATNASLGRLGHHGESNRAIQIKALRRPEGAGAVATRTRGAEATFRRMSIRRIWRPSENDIAHGRILLMVDVPKEQVYQWKQLILGHHPEATIGVTALPQT